MRIFIWHIAITGQKKINEKITNKKDFSKKNTIDVSTEKCGIVCEKSCNDLDAWGKRKPDRFSH